MDAGLLYATSASISRSCARSRIRVLYLVTHTRSTGTHFTCFTRAALSDARLDIAQRLALAFAACLPHDR